MKLNRILLIAAAALFLLSFLTYRNSVERAERFERGQKFLPHLNPDEIAQITIEKGEETTRLRRVDDRFVVATAERYPAKNEAVNRFISDVLDLGLEKEVGSGEDLERELEVAEDGDSTIEVTFKDANDKEMVRFLVGKAFEEGSGNYVRRLDQEESPIYLTSSRVTFTTAGDEFLDKEIVDVKTADLAAVSGADFRLEKPEDGGAFELVDPPPGTKLSAKANQLTAALSGLRFEKHLLANAPEVQGLRFDRVVEYDLPDDSGYRVEVAERDGEHYLQITGFHRAEQLSIARDAGEEEVKETADALARMDELQRFNNLHGSWIYQIGESTAKRFRVDKSDLVEKG